MIEKCKNLAELWDIVHQVNKEHFPHNNLMPILGGGKTRNPKFMFVFINPTAKNISSDRKWAGPRFPFIGTRQVWRIFHRAGLFDDELMQKINNSSYWSLDLTDKVLAFLKEKSFYFTNIVKRTGNDAALPDAEKIKMFLPILEREIQLVRPHKIITFGLIPFENMTGQKIKLKDYYSDVINDRRLRSYKIRYGAFKTEIIPCYFPVGRGDPGKAVEILRLLER